MHLTVLLKHQINSLFVVVALTHLLCAHNRRNCNSSVFVEVLFIIMFQYRY